MSRYVDGNKCNEVTLECNSDDLSCEYIDALHVLPVNRISMGVQSFDDEDLRFLRRRHTAQTAIEAINRCKNAGYHNISIDLIYGLPRQSLSAWEENIEKAIATEVPHISAYSLIYEEGTALKALQEKGIVEECDEELSLTMYQRLIQRLEAAGYRQYEISNFAIPDMESRHNSSYWNDVPYLGLGAAAHSYDGAKRRYNPPDTKAYITAITQGRCCYDEEILSEKDKFNDMLLTRLRTRQGIDLHTIEQQFSTEFTAHLHRLAIPHLQSGMLEYNDNYLRISRQGIFISDTIISDLFFV